MGESHDGELEHRLARPVTAFIKCFVVVPRYLCGKECAPDCSFWKSGERCSVSMLRISSPDAEDMDWTYLFGRNICMGDQLYEVTEAVTANNVWLTPILGDKIPSNSGNEGDCCFSLTQERQDDPNRKIMRGASSWMAVAKLSQLDQMRYILVYRLLC